MKYIYHVGTNKVICLTRYAGKTVKGTAKCDPSDTFSEKDGKELSKARCDVKTSKEKVKLATIKYQQATIDYLEAKSKYDYAKARYEDECKNLTESKKILVCVENRLRETNK